MTHLVVALLICQAPPEKTRDGGWDSPIYGACEEFRDSGFAEQTDGGAWLVPQGRMSLTACRLASCQAALAATPASEVSPSLVLGLVGGGLLLVGLGVVLGYAAPHPK